MYKMEIYNLNQIISLPITEDNVGDYKYHIKNIDIINIINTIENNYIYAETKYYDKTKTIRFRNKNPLKTDFIEYKRHNNKSYYFSDDLKLSFYKNIDIINEDNSICKIIFLGEIHQSQDFINNIDMFINSNLAIFDDLKLYTNLFVEVDISDLSLSYEILTNINSLHLFGACNNTQNSIQYDNCYKYCWYNFTDVRHGIYDPEDNNIIDFFYYINKSVETEKDIKNNFNRFQVLFESNIRNNKQLFNYITENSYVNLDKKDIYNIDNLTFCDILDIIGIDSNIFSYESFLNNCKNIYLYYDPNLYYTLERTVDYKKLYNFINNYYGLIFFGIFFDNRIYKYNKYFTIFDSIRKYFFSKPLELKLFMYYFVYSNLYIRRNLFKSLSLYYLYNKKYLLIGQLSENIDYKQIMNDLHVMINSIILDLNIISRVNVKDKLYKKEVSPIYSNTDITYNIIYTGAYHSISLYNYYDLYNYVMNNPEVDIINLIKSRNEFYFTETSSINRSSIFYNQDDLVIQDRKYYLSFRDIFITNKKDILDKLNIIKDYLYTIDESYVLFRNDELTLSNFRSTKLLNSKRDVDLYSNKLLFYLDVYSKLLQSSLQNYLKNRNIQNIFKNIIIEDEKLHGFIDSIILSYNICNEKHEYGMYNTNTKKQITLNCLFNYIFDNYSKYISDNSLSRFIIAEIDNIDTMFLIVNENIQEISNELIQNYSYYNVFDNYDNFIYNMMFLLKLLLLQITVKIYDMNTTDNIDFYEYQEKLYEYIDEKIFLTNDFYLYNVMIEIINYLYQNIIDNPVQLYYTNIDIQSLKNKLNYYVLILSYITKDVL